MKKIIVGIVVVLAVVGYLWWDEKQSQIDPGPEGGFSYIEDLIYVTSPRPTQVVTSPMTISGRARGTWFFEASFPVSLVNWDGLIIAQGIATAQGEWMTEDFVPFEAVLEFEKPTLYPERGALILQKDNPSGLPENDAALEIPVRFE